MSVPDFTEYFQVETEYFLSWNLNVQTDTVSTCLKVCMLKDVGPVQGCHMWVCLCLIACGRGNIKVCVHTCVCTLKTNCLNVLKFSTKVRPRYDVRFDVCVWWMWRMTVFWDVTPYSLIERHSSTLNIEVAGSSVYWYLSTGNMLSHPRR
jgi:hypothetical protein